MARPRSASQEFAARVAARGPAAPRPRPAPPRRRPAFLVEPLAAPARESAAAAFDRGLSATILLVALFTAVILLPARAGSALLDRLVDRPPARAAPPAPPAPEDEDARGSAPE